MIKERVIFILIILILLIFIGFLAYRQFYDQKENTSPVARDNIPAYAGTVVQEENITLTQTFIGTVAPVHTVDVLPFISGFIDQVFVKGGESVQTGDELFMLQQRQYSAQKEAAAANVQSAEATLKNAEIYLNRIKKTKSEAVSQTELDNAQTSYLSAEAQLKAEKANLAIAEVNYDYTVIKAPIDGIVGNVAITKGNYVTPSGQPLARIIQQTPMRVQFSMSNKEYLQTKTADKPLFEGWIIKIKTADGQIYPQTGTFQYIDNMVAGQTSGITVYVDFPNPNGVLMANAYVEVLLEKKITGILLNKNQVHLTENGAYVNVIRNNKIERQNVALGGSVGQNYVIEKGLNVGDFVLKGTISDSLLNTPAKPMINNQNEKAGA